MRESEPLIVYYSSPSGNTHHFVEQVGIRAMRIPVSIKKQIFVEEPYVLICPTYADNYGKGAVPKQVIQFLNNPQNRELMEGVISSGNRNFGEFFAYSGHVISHKCNVPWLYKFELRGEPKDVINVKTGVRKLWNSLIQPIRQQKRTVA